MEAVDCSWIICQLALTAEETFYGVCVCTRTNTNKGTQLLVAELQCFLSIGCYLFNKHLHMKNNLHSVFILCTVSCWEAQEPFLLAECLYIIYSLFASVFIDILIVNSLFNNTEQDYGVFWTLEIIYWAKCFRGYWNVVLLLFRPTMNRFLTWWWIRKQIKYEELYTWV